MRRRVGEEVEEPDRVILGGRVGSASACPEEVEPQLVHLEEETGGRC